MFIGVTIAIVVQHVVPVERRGGQGANRRSADHLVSGELAGSGLRPAVIAHHLCQCCGHTACGWKFSGNLGAGFIVGLMLIPPGGHHGRNVVVSCHFGSLATQCAEPGDTLGRGIEPPLQVVGDIVGVEAALCGVTQHQVVTHAVVTAHHDIALCGICIEDIVSRRLVVRSSDLAAMRVCAVVSQRGTLCLEELCRHLSGSCGRN